jgi:hypothetical protein
MIKLFEDAGCKDWLDVVGFLAIGLVGAAAVYGGVLVLLEGEVA